MLHFDYQLQHRLSHLGIVRGAGSQNLAACLAPNSGRVGGCTLAARAFPNVGA